MDNNRLKKESERSDTKMVGVPFPLFEKMVNYLTGQTYREVVQLLNEMSRCNPVEEPVKEKVEDAPKG